MVESSPMRNTHVSDGDPIRSNSLSGFTRESSARWHCIEDHESRTFCNLNQIDRGGNSPKVQNARTARNKNQVSDSSRGKSSGFGVRRSIDDA